MSDDQHSYDNDGMASINEIEEEPDTSDDEYDMWVMDSIEDLDKDIQELIKKYVTQKQRYYYEQEERLLEHIKTKVQYELDKISVRREEQAKEEIIKGVN